MVPSDNYDIILRTDGAVCIVDSHIHISFSDNFVLFDISNIQQCTLDGFIKLYESFFTDMFTMCQGWGHFKKMAFAFAFNLHSHMQFSVEVKNERVP